MEKLLQGYGYPTGDLGFYLQPLERGRACHVEFNFHFNPHQMEEVEKIQKLYKEACRVLLDMGAFFTRPYGVLAELVYSKTSQYVSALKRVKNLLDPNNIMCPGNLCF